MGKVRVMWGSAVLAVAVVVLAASAQEEPEAEVTVRTQLEQTVIYTVYRGPYEGMGESVVKLFDAGFQKELALRPELGITLVYLNSPELVAPAHFLTEIRVPVDEAALAHEGTLGDFTDVKVVGVAQVAAITKPDGVIERAPYILKLEDWAVENGYAQAGARFENMLGQSADAESEIMVPVRKVVE